jgi:hypothetical protein
MHIWDPCIFDGHTSACLAMLLALLEVYPQHFGDSFVLALHVPLHFRGYRTRTFPSYRECFVRSFAR